MAWRAEAKYLAGRGDFRGAYEVVKRFGGTPPLPQPEGGPANIQQANTIEFFPPALALIVRAPSRIHTSLTGGVIGGKVKRVEAAMLNGGDDGKILFAKGGAVGGAKGKFGNEYTFQYEGQPLLFENHVTLGRSHNPQDCLSVHWLRDDDRKRFVVGWCGKHRTNTRT